MNVAAEQHDRRGRATTLPGGELGEDLDEAVKGVLERRPMLHVETAAKLLAEMGDQPPPGPVTERLVPRLDVVEGGGEQHRQRARE